MSRAAMRLGWVLVVLLAGVACRTLTREEEGMSAEELRDRLNEFVQRLVNDVDDTSDAIAAQTDDLMIRRTALSWKIHSVEIGQETLLTEPPTAAFLDLWTLIVQMRQYVDEGEGRGKFGEGGRELALATMKDLEGSIEDLGEKLLEPEQLEETRTAVHEFVDENPLVVVRGRVSNRPASALESDASSTFAEVLSLPLAPFRAFGGIDNAATAVHEFAGVADRFTTIVQSLPEQATWHLELLLYDIQYQQTIESLLTSLEEGSASFTRFTATAEQVAETADRLPEELRTTLQASIDAVDAAQPELQKTLAEARATAEALGGAAQSVEGAVGQAVVMGEAFERTAARFVEAGQAWEATAHAFGLPGDDEPDEPPPADTGEEEAGFDVEAYGTSAEKLTEAAVQIRKLVEQIDALLDADRLAEVDAATTQALQTTEERARSLTDHIAWRAVQVLLAGLGGLLVYKLLASRLIR